MSYELQNIDCNCNNCMFMERDNALYAAWLEKHNAWAFDYFTTIKNKLIDRANYWQKMGDDKKQAALLKEADAMRYQFNKKDVSINYGWCTKLNKRVTFIPNTIQLDTQNCFKNRKDEKNAA